MTAVEVWCVLAGLVIGWVSAGGFFALSMVPEPRRYLSIAASVLHRQGVSEDDARDVADRVIRSVYRAWGHRRA